MGKNYHFWMESQRVEEEWQNEKGPFEDGAMKKKCAVLQTTGVQKAQGK